MAISRGIHIAEKNPMWKGDKVGYHALHTWITRWFGKATTCEKNCIYPRKDSKGKIIIKPKRYEWANISGKYKRNRSDWIQLCVSCHRKYDRKPDYKPWNKGKVCPQISARLKGKKASLETRTKQSLAKKGKLPWNKGKINKIEFSCKFCNIKKYTYKKNQEFCSKSCATRDRMPWKKNY